MRYRVRVDIFYSDSSDFEPLVDLGQVRAVLDGLVEQLAVEGFVADCVFVRLVQQLGLVVCFWFLSERRGVVCEPVQTVPGDLFGAASDCGKQRVFVGLRAGRVDRRLLGPDGCHVQSLPHAAVDLVVLLVGVDSFYFVSDDAPWSLEATARAGKVELFLLD